MKAKTTEISIETQERILFRQTSSHEIERICGQCETHSVFLNPERAALLFNVTAREIYRRVERGAIHFIETASGTTLVCAASLSGATDERTKFDSTATNALSNSPLQA